MIAPLYFPRLSYKIVQISQMQESNPEKKVAVREKNRTTAKDFINMRRGKLREEKSNSAAFSAIRGHIASGDCQNFEEALLQNRPEAMLTFLFSEDELKETPIVQVVKSQHCLGLLGVVNRWSKRFSDLIVREIYMEGNELKSNDFRAKFHNLNKLILQLFNERISAGKAIDEQIALLGETDSLFYHLCKNFLKLELIISSLNNIKTKNDLLTAFYHTLLTRTDLKELQELARQVSGYQSIIIRDRLWSKVDADVVKGISGDHVDLLTLKELGYNVWHELANRNAKEFFRTIEVLGEGEGEVNERLWKMMLEVDSSGEIATDKCLRLWTYNDIQQLIKVSASVENLMLSINCLAKLFRNRKLKQIERQCLITQFLQGSIASKGYVKILPKVIQKLQKGKNEGQVLHLQVKPQRFTYNICYDKLQAKKQLDSCGDYPLVTYLKTYKGNSSLKTVQQLFLEAYSRKYAKKMSLLLRKTIQTNKVLEYNSGKLQEIQQLFDYYQPLWKIVTFLPHGDLMEFLISKIYTNCNEIHIKKRYAYTEVRANGLHFIAHYILNNPFLGEDGINKGLIDAILNCKDSERNAGKYGLAQELMRSLIPIPSFHTSQEYLIVTMRNYLKQQILELDNEQFIATREIWGNFVLMDHISKPLYLRKPTILTEEQFVSKFSPSFLYYYLECMMHPSQVVKKSFNKYFQKLFSKNYPEQEIVERQYSLSDFSIKSLYDAQDHYLFRFSPERRNASFFDGFKDQLSSITEIEHANERIYLKFYCFRLRAEEKYLTYKFKRLLSLGIDPYFSKYSKKDLKFDGEDAKWGQLMKRMVQEECTFLFAFITAPHVDFSAFEETFQAAIAEGKESQWIGWSLPRKIHDMLFHIKRQAVFKKTEEIFSQNIKPLSYFTKNKRRPLNFDAVAFILQLAYKQGFPLQNYFTFLVKSFELNIYESIRQIQYLSQPGKADSPQLIKKKQELSKVIEKWVAYIVDRLQSEKQKFKEECRQQKNPLIEERSASMTKIENFWYQFFHNLLQYSLDRKHDYVLWSLIKDKKLKDIPNRNQMFMLQRTEDAYTELSTHFLSLQNADMNIWVYYLVASEQKGLLSLFKAFSVIKQKGLINIIGKSIQNAQLQEDKYMKKHLSQNLSILLKFLLQSVSLENVPEVIRFIQDESTLVEKQKYLKCLLHSTTNIELIVLDLLVVNHRKSSLFCIDFEGEKSKKLRKFSSVNFYSKCNDQMFNTYIKTVAKHYSLSKHLPQHLQTAINGLVSGKLWARLSKVFEIEALRVHTAGLIIMTLYQSLNDSNYSQPQDLKKLISLLFAYLKKASNEFDEKFFVAAYFFNQKEAFAIFKPTQLSIKSFKKCIKAHPEGSSLFLSSNVSLNCNNLPVELKDIETTFHQNVRNWFPLQPHFGFERKPWLVDEIELQLRLLKTLKVPRYIMKTLESCCHRREILMRKQVLLADLIDDQTICKFILRNKSIESLEMYRQFIPNLTQIVKGELISRRDSKKGKCLNLNTLNPKLLRHLISEKYFKFEEKHDLFSTFLRVIDTANLELVDLFLKVNNITVNIAFLRDLQESLSMSFWDHLLAVFSQSFVADFITKFQLFDIYNKDEYSPKLLTSICRLRRNKLLQFTINYFEKKSGKKAVFVAQSLTNKPSISQNAVFFMPIQESIDSNYYEAYFLITSCKNVCPMFNVSTRFLSYVPQDEWNFLPEMKRRVELNNAFMKCLTEAAEMTFRQDVLLTSIFQLQKIRRRKVKVAQEPPKREKASSKGYSQSLRKFIFGLTNKNLTLNYESGSFEKLCFMIFKRADTKIPEALIEKKYPAQMKIISSIRKFLDDQEVHINLTELFTYVPEFKSLLLIYNPQAFLSNPEYLQEITGEGDKKLDFSEYLRGIQINFVEFEAKYFDVLKKYIENYFFNSSIPIGNPKASLHLTRQALVLLFLEIAHYERKWTKCPIFNICKRRLLRERESPIQQECETQMVEQQRIQNQSWSMYSSQEILYDLSMNLNIRGNGDMAFDLMGWNKIIAEIEDIQNSWKSLGKSSMKKYSFNEQERKEITRKYSEIITKKEGKYSIINLDEILTEIFEQHITNCNKKGAMIELSLILNSLLLVNDIKVLDDKLKSIKGGSSIERYNIKLVKAFNNEVSFDSPTELNIEIKYSIEGHQSKQLSLLIVDYGATIQKLQHSLYYSDFLQNSQVLQINAFCAKADRQQFLKNYKFRYNVDSFSSLGYESMLNILEHGNWKNDGVVGKMLYEMEKMEERLIGTKNIKVYSTSDIYGPINFSDEVEDEKIVDCLGFYELLQLPKEQEISISYADKKALTPQERNQMAVRQIKRYLQYYIALAKDQAPSQPQMGSEVCVSVRKEKGEEKVQVDWCKFGAWTICEVYCLVLNYCSDLSSKIEKILDVRVSFQSLIQYYEKYLEIGQGDGLKIALERLLFQKNFNRLVESIIIMITEDVGNIMKIVKGIIIRWDINSNSKKRANIVISEFASANSVGYTIKDQLLYITINLEMQKQLNVGVEGEDCTILVDRKEFLDSVFTSAQFLTDYFLMRNELNTACLNISTSLTNRLNSTVNFHIEYGNLYSHVDLMRANRTIKDIESFLLRLRQYLLASMEKVLTLYLNSQELANQHQVFLLNKCESINRKISYDEVEGAKTLQYDSLEIEPKSGLFETNALMGEIGNEEAIKSTFLIQIFKSYYTTMVGQGMTFVVGYKSGKRKAQVIKITKAENINLINILELDYIMLVSRNLPTTDELNHSKIIRIFLTDANRNLYRLADPLAQYFLTLHDEHQDRSLAHFAPLIPSNIRLAFYETNQREKDPRDIKTFFIDLGDSKFKLAPLPDRPLTPLNSCKKNYEFKQAIVELQHGLRKFCSESMKIVIDLPQEFTEKYVGVNFSHIVHLVGSDVLQFLLKLEFQPMRNPSLDCKLSVQKNFIVNKNSIIQLRKRTLLAYFRSIRISIREEPSKISFKGEEITVSIDTSNMATLPSSSQYLSAILDNILSKQKAALPNYVRFDVADKDQSTEVLLKEFDLINCIPYQIEEIETAITLIHLLFGHKFNRFGIHIQKKKTEVRFDEGIDLHFNIQSGQREFYSAQDLIRLFVANRNKGHEPNTKSQTYFDFLNKSIVIDDSSEDTYTLAYVDREKQWHKLQVKAVKDNTKMIIPLPTVCPIPSRYYLIQSLNVYSNFTFNVDQSIAVNEKNCEGVRDKPKTLYLQSPKEINLNFTNISVTETNPLFKDITNNFNILQKTGEKNIIQVRLLSKNIYNILLKYGQSMILNINYAGNINPLNPNIDSSRLVISSDGALCLDNTKFLELEGYKRKPVLIKERENESGSHEFRESHEQASEMEFESKPGDATNIENLVYVVNDQCKKFLTRAGEHRTDYLQLCDADSNPIDYKHNLDVKFVHINRLAVVQPEIFRRGMQFGLKWTPIIRGHYYLYINGTRMSPPYEIGVCAGQADYKRTITTLPKVQKLCYCEESELMLDLRDSFGNLYTQLEEDIIGDSLILEMRCSNMAESLKLQKTPINKYGLKKLKFSFNNGQAEAPTQVEVELYLNCEPITHFSLTIQGLSLKQRKKLLDKDISLSSKNYYKDITINRNKFLEDLFTIAEKSLHTNLSVKFVNEPGIDAGGVKRQFYDMVGNEIKSERNPFFKLINPNTMEYFLNPEILRNKKKLEYMELWGKYVANSFLNGYLIGVSFSPVFVKLLYDQTINFEDLLSVLPADQRKQYEYLLAAAPQDFQDLDLYFTAMVDKKKCIEVELIEGGKGIAVTATNVKQYLQCTAQVLLTERYREIIIAFKKGFETVLELGIFKKWIRNTEFWCLTAGNKELTPQLVLNYIVFQGSNIDNISGWFRRYINEATPQILIGFLKFSSGSSSIDFSLASKVTVTFENSGGENPKKLPISHTCWKEIVVPKYKNYDIMKKLLTAAFIYCSEGFGFG